MVVLVVSFFLDRRAQEMRDLEDRRRGLALTELTGEIRAGQIAGDRRLEQVLAAVQSIVVAERTITEQIVRREIQAGPTQTVTATATVTKTETFRPGPPTGPPGPPFGPAGCVEVLGVTVCREAGMGAMLLGLAGFGFVIMRRTRDDEENP